MSVKTFYSEAYNCEGYGVDTREKARDIAMSLNTNPIEGLEICAPQPVTEEQFRLAHSAQYTMGIFQGRPEAAADRNGLGPWSRDLSNSVLHSTGGVVAAASTAFATGKNSGSLSSGIHHARKNFGAGFCTANGLIISARVLLAQGAQRVVIVDLDAHCGGGTASLIKTGEGIEQVDVSVSAFDSYESRANAQLTMSNGERYLDDIRAALNSIADPSSIDVVLYNAGMDPHENCNTGGVDGISTFDLYQREKMVFHWAAEAKVPVAFVLAGGYSGSRLSRAELVDLHRLTLQAAVEFDGWC